MSDTPQEEKPNNEELSHQHSDADGKNAKSIRCTYCSSLILKPANASLVALETTLPKIDGEHEPETITKFWCVQDIFQFENCSFSKQATTSSGTVIKYLSCCDCDIGPIGYQNLDNSLCYVATERVTYVES